MRELNKIKKLFIVAMLTVVTAIFFLLIPQVAASSGISTNVSKYKYEENDIYYSDGYFAHSAEEYDPHLATLSILMAKYSMNPGGPDNMQDFKWYDEQPNRVKGFFELIGFDSFRPNMDYKERTSFDTIGIAAAKKQVGDYTLIGVTVRSGGYFLEWSNNVYLGDGTKSDYMHEGWYNAANALIVYLKAYIKDYNITGRIKVWVAGFSRGAAVSNLAAGLMDNEIEKNKGFLDNGTNLTRDNLYAYTFETPQGANINSKNVKAPKDPIYNNIWNVINPNDLVTKVAMSAYGFTRFGQDKFITTKFYDPEGFEQNRAVYKKIYSESYKDVDKYSADDFEMRGVPGSNIAGILASTVVAGPVGGALVGYLIHKTNGLTEKDTRKANYDSNIVSSLLLDELCNCIGTREDYCKRYQGLAKDIMQILMNDSKEDKREKLITFISSILLETLLRSVGLNNVKVIQLAYPSFEAVALEEIVNIIGVFINVYVNKPNEVITTIMNISNIFANHGTDINVVHLECQDSYYIDAYNAKHSGTDSVKLVSLRDNADLVHMSFNGYNDIQVTDENKKQVVDVEGHVFGRSDVKKCDPNCAVGYYSYITEEKMELFLPVNKTYNVSFKGYSKKLYHKVTYSTACQYISASSKKQSLPAKSDTAWFNTDRVNLTINVKP